jgi:hypothetical protein
MGNKIIILVALICGFMFSVAIAHERPTIEVYEVNELFSSRSSALDACDAKAKSYTLLSSAFCHHHNNGDGTGTYLVFYTYQQHGGDLQVQSAKKWVS